jgi:hypothetical protein
MKKTIEWSKSRSFPIKSCGMRITDFKIIPTSNFATTRSIIFLMSAWLYSSWRPLEQHIKFRRRLFYFWIVTLNYQWICPKIDQRYLFCNVFNWAGFKKNDARTPNLHLRIQNGAIGLKVGFQLNFVTLTTPSWTDILPVGKISVLIEPDRKNMRRRSRIMNDQMLELS